ncbi:hypothetical protein [Saliphagus sp. LR7]|uniref:DUF7544 domain-containing protein n=1 Tax=Saliphagus sp. LR7 TaxID=2282654 RepID=UPI000DF800CB|nr:hypothetical protein [Saliphagus sp. LR7]
MTWRALAELRPSLEATKGLLFPFSLRRWLALGVIAFFVSGASGANPNLSMTGGGTSEESPAVDSAPIDGVATLSDAEIVLALLIVGLAVAIGLALLLVGAIMEFVFVRVATERDVRIRGYVGENVSRGTSLFLFRLGIVFVLLALFVAPVLAAFVLSPVFVVLVVLLVPGFLLAGIGLWLVLRFTADFIVPVMVVEDLGVLAGWRAFWPALVDDWKQYGVYAVARLLLGIGAGVLAGLGFVAVGLALLVPFGLVGAVVYLVFGVLAGVTWLAVASLVVLAALYALAVLVSGVTCVQVPIQTYLRYYSLFVLGSVTPRFDVVEAVRSEVGDPAGDRSPTDGR